MDYIENIENIDKSPEKSSERKQVPLRLSAALWRDLSAWAEDEFRSLNGQIEYLLFEAVKHRRGAPPDKRKHP